MEGSTREKREREVARRCACALLLALAPLGAGSLTRARGLGRCKWRALPRPVQGRRPDLRRWGAAASNGARSRARSRGAALVPGAGALRPLLPLRQWRCTAAPSVTSVVALCPLDTCSQNYNVATVGRCSCCCPVALASLVAGATRRASRDACVTTRQRSWRAQNRYGRCWRPGHNQLDVVGNRGWIPRSELEERAPLYSISHRLPHPTLGA